MAGVREIDFPPYRAGQKLRLSLDSLFLHPLIVLSIVVTPALSQRTTGNLQGRLVDSLGQAVPRANIVVGGPNVQGMRGGTSDKDGYFILHALPTGIVSVSVTHVQYQPVMFENVSVELGRTTNLGEVRLRSRSHEMPEIIVSGAGPLIDPTTTSYVANLRSAEFEALPVDRNYRSILSLLPQANLSYLGDEVNIAGATGRENRYFVDGVDVSDSHWGRKETNLPYDFVKEIQVTTGGYEAEYRNSLGGLVNVVTHSGSNTFHGSVFGFYTSNQLRAPQRIGSLDPTQGSYFNYDIGGSFGGPIVQNELWWFVAYNPTITQRDAEVPNLGTYVDKTMTQSFAGKLTWRPSERLSLVLTSTGDPSNRKAIGDDVSVAPDSLENPDPYLTNVSEGGVNVALNSSYTIGDNIFVDASISRTTRREIHEPSTERGEKEIVFIDGQTGMWSGGGFGPYSFFKFSTGARLNATLMAGSHTLKTGIEYRDNGVEADVSRSNIRRFSDSLYVQLINRDLGTVHNRIPSVFFQDTWQVSNSLRLHAGMRWDGQFIVATDGKVAQEIIDQFQPRIGFVFLADHEGNHKIYGSFGRFSQELHNVVSQFYHTDQGYFYIINYDADPRGATAVADTVWSQPHRIEPSVSGLKGQYYDEFGLGYEFLMSSNIKIGVQGIHRTLGEAVEDGAVGGRWRLGNPGRGILSDLPKPRRDYAALVLTVEKRDSGPFNFLASYVLSRNYGNYPGLFDSFFLLNGSNISPAFDDVGAMKKATGLLPNDRTHVLKFSGSYHFDFGLVAGTSFIWQSGTPLSEWAGSAGTQIEWYLAPRGTSGRTPAIWDLNARIVYEIPGGGLGTRLILDILNIASQRRPVNIVQQHFFDVDQNGNGVGLNPSYGRAYRYQPPMSVRLGIEVGF